MRRIITAVLLLILGSTITAATASHRHSGRKRSGRSIEVAFITDLHITPGNDNDSIIDPLIEEINAGGYDLVVVGGDMTNMGSCDELCNIHRKLSRLTAPQLVVAGNHETTWSESACTEFERLWGHDSRTFVDAGEYRFVGYQAGPFMKMADGTVRREDLRWVDSVMTATPDNMRIVSVCHYPLSNDVTNRREITSVLRSHNVCATLCGHYHKPSLNNYDSIPGILGRSLMLRRDGRPTYGYTIVRFGNDSIYVSEKLVGERPARQYAIRQGISREVAALPCDPPMPPLDMGDLDAECIVEDNGSIYTAAAVDSNGETIYYGNSLGQIKAYDTWSRTQRWCRQFSSAIYSSPIYYNGLLIAATVSDGLWALDACTGRTVWCNDSLETMIGDGIIADGALYIGVDGKMMRIDPADGHIVWSFDYGAGQPQGRPAVADGRVVFGAWNCHLYCLDAATGEMSWSWNNGSSNKLFSPGHIVPRIAQGRVMIVAPDRYMTFIDLDTGRQLWRIKERKVRETTGLSDDGKLFLAKTMDGEMIAVKTDADAYAEQWAVDAGWGYDHNFCPITTRGGVAYMANRTGMVAAVEISGGRLLNVAKLADSSANEFTLDGRGSLWVTFIDGRIYRIGR
ncbi:MAG: PQQ-binding-like beta-propeller repeat protein [Alistipes sp.]|nr:PQQ-binding-like beta-propeller repeat protein [Alistipes sp.]